MIPRHFRSTTKVTSSVYKTPTSSASQMTKAKLPGSREAPIYHETRDSVMQDPGGFEETIPQLIRQTWQFEGRPTVYIGINPNTSKPKGIAFNA